MPSLTGEGENHTFSEEVKKKGIFTLWGRSGFDGGGDAKAACRGPTYLVNPWTKTQLRTITRTQWLPN